jgi:NRAMP (natural resistance-associated macrophage protein)-like metal ion transporter
MKTSIAGRVHRFFANLGPGLITGAADDDPSGISTYSVAGAAFGLQLLWTAILSFPLMAAVQLMCGRLGLVTGLGLAGAIRTYYSKSVLWMACALLITANVVNIAADLGGMADVTEVLSGVSSAIWTPAYTVLVLVLLIWTSYRTIVKIFKWLTLTLLAYVVTAFLAQPDWPSVLSSTLVPEFEWSSQYWATLVGILGTTISPYLFFWQAAQEVEVDKSKGRHSLEQRRGASPEELKGLQNDVLTGMLFSNLVMYFIILTSAVTLHANGVVTIGTAREAAEALRPLAGDQAFLLFSFGLIGAGMLGVPVLAGSCAYAISEAAGWSGSLNAKPKQATGFYLVIGLAMSIGLGLDFANLDAVKMLFWAAVLNGVLAPPLLVLVVLLTSREDVMGEHRNGFTLRFLGWLCAGLMFVAALIMVASELLPLAY